MDDKNSEEIETPKPSEYRRMVSDVWEYCTRISDTLVQCNHCSKVMSFHGTTNIRVHVGRHFGMKPVRCRSTGRLPRNIKLPPANPGQQQQLHQQQQQHTPQVSPQSQPQPSPPPTINQKKAGGGGGGLPPLAPKPSGGTKGGSSQSSSTSSSATIKQLPKLLPKPQTPPEVCLRWNSYHSNMQNTFPSLLNNEQFVDVTLACDGRSIKCHKVMLSACSPYMEELLSSNPCQHPIIFLKDMKFWQLQALIDFMYRGEVNVTQDKLPSLLSAAEALQIKGTGLASPVNHSAPPKITQVQPMPTAQHDISDEMDQVTYMRHLQLQTDIKTEYDDEYMQDTDESPPPTPKAKKRKTSHVSPYGSIGGGGGANNVGTTSGGNNIILNNNSHKQLLVNKTTKREKERHSEPSTSNQHVTQALPNQHGTADQHRRKSDNDKIVGDSDNEYKNYCEDNRHHTTTQDEELDLDEEHAQIILERYSSQNNDYSRTGDGGGPEGDGDENSTTSG
ncbi:bric-A-brac, putative [Pediculus humanus corporis]|uniref:Bric-A-brac, putative n=1 Tax=Pediculus humanus subsp. corporis TaxID=121224 RepID=E0W2L6_PEDHC|nr:bric-A-brac, putative [Pediculus humanus corporis]EEB19872.1 bric-A-brac, putative [Pediculus humanus corporis]